MPIILSGTGQAADPAATDPQVQMQAKFTSLLYATEGRVATITLNRPERLNAISPSMPKEIAQAVRYASCRLNLNPKPC